MPLDFLFGSVRENAEREYDNYDFESGTRKKDLGDHIGDFLTGRGAAIDEAVKKEHIRRLEQDYGVAADEVRTYLGGGAKLPNIDANTDPLRLKQEIQRAAPKVQEVKDAKAFAAQNGILLQPSQYNGDAAAMLSDANTQIEGKAETKRLKLKGENDAENLRKEGRADNLLMMQMLQNNRQSDRQFQLQQAQQDYQNRALDLKESRLDRKDRQAAIQAMMAGLSQLGASIAI
jgi:hypothetical protein